MNQFAAWSYSLLYLLHAGTAIFDTIFLLPLIVRISFVFPWGVGIIFGSAEEMAAATLSPVRALTLIDAEDIENPSFFFRPIRLASATAGFVVLRKISCHGWIGLLLDR